ncbi:Uncharacterized protein Fot_18306 [Forsythia ovata]|uniref:Uncharacterized protein n=1 Tax=Forsythia ovata TaxID=205694 RepID=A0ABD1VKI4_9LAMI
MNGEKKKRKLENRENEEEKMESFFALIKSTRDIRQSMMSGVDQLKKKDSVKAIEDKPPVVAWNPSFQPEDFMEDLQHIPLDYKTQLVAGGPSKVGKEEPKDEDEATPTHSNVIEAKTREGRMEMTVNRGVHRRVWRRRAWHRTFRKGFRRVVNNGRD